MVEVSVAGARNVPMLVGRVPSVGLREPEAAVDDDPIRFRKTLGQCDTVYQRMQNSPNCSSVLTPQSSL